MSEMPLSAIVNQKLLRAAIEGRIDDLRPLVDEGADPNQSVDGRSLLAALVAEATPMPLDGVALVISALVAAGADVNAVGPDGMTPLLTALQGNRRDVIEALLAAGASVNVMPRGKVSPLYLATEGDLAETEDWRTRLLVAHGANPDTYIAVLEEYGAPSVRLMLEKTAVAEDAVTATGVVSLKDFAAHARHLLSCMPPAQPPLSPRQAVLQQKAGATAGKYKVQNGGPRR